MDYIDEPFKVAIRRETAIITWPSGEKRAVPLDVFRMDVATATEALNAYDHGNIVAFPRQKRPRKPKGDASGG